MNGISDRTRTLIGMVTTMNVFSWMDPPSAGLEVTIKPPNEAAQTLRMGADAAPQVFAAAATILLNAYQTKTSVQVTIPAGQPPTQTPQISRVTVPA
jgi:hypothetical protein